MLVDQKSLVASKSMAETVRLEEFTGLIQNKLVAVWSANDASVWLPTEFLLSQYITRILVVGRTAPASLTLAADSSWTQVWRSPGAKEWSCLLGVLAHMPGPILIVVGPDIGLTPKLVTAIRSAGVTTVALRSQVAGWPAGAEQADQVFFPVLSASAGLMPTVQEWVGRSSPRALDVKLLLPQLAAQEYGLTVAEGVWHWYRPADSAALVTLTVGQIAKQLQVIGSMLEKMSV
jgi:hypothetical protein